MASLNFIGCSLEISALFDRYDADGNSRLPYKEFSSKLIGVKPDVEGNPILRGIMDRVRQKVLEQGGLNGIRVLSNMFRSFDETGRGLKLNERELRQCFRDYG